MVASFECLKQQSKVKCERVKWYHHLLSPNFRGSVVAFFACSEHGGSKSSASSSSGAALFFEPLGGILGWLALSYVVDATK
jgi:hypothetical protein